MRSLARKTILGYINLLVLLGAGIFLPAWTLNYWQGWVYIVVFVGCSVLITLYLWKNDPKLLERRVSGGPVAERQAAQKVIMMLACAGFIALVVVPALDHRLQWSHVPSSITILGNILVTLGFLIVFVVFRENSFSSATIEVASDQRVVSTGPYAIVRHPMYAGGLILLIGTPLALGSYTGLFALAAMTPVLIWRLFDEERFLSGSLPGYTDYCAKVRWRLIPGVF